MTKLSNLTKVTTVGDDALFYIVDPARPSGDKSVGMDKDDVKTLVGGKEEDIEGTTTENATATGTVNLDLSTFVDADLTLTGNTTITVSNTPATGKSFVRNITVQSTVSESLTLPVSWNIYGEFLADTSRNKLTIVFSNFTTAGLEVDCFISQPTI